MLGWIVGEKMEVLGSCSTAQAAKPKRVPVGRVWPVERVKGAVVTRTLVADPIFSKGCESTGTKLLTQLNRCKTLTFFQEAIELPEFWHA